MPIVEPKQISKEVEDFESAFLEDDEDRSTKTEVTDETKTDEAGEATKDQTPVDTETEVQEDPIKAGMGQEETTLATDAVEAWKVKAEDYEAQLKKERQRTASWDGRIKAANQKVKDLEAENKGLREKMDAIPVDEKTPDQMSDPEKIEMFKKSFPELADFADIMDRKMATIKPAEVKAEKEQEEVVIDPVEETASTESDEHWPTVEKAHSDVNEIVSSGVLLTHINSKPDFIKDHLLDIYYGKDGKGTSTNVIKLITEFKNTTGWKSQLAKPEQGSKSKQDKLNSMLETENASAGAPKEGPDKNDFNGTAKEIGL